MMKQNQLALLGAVFLTFTSISSVTSTAQAAEAWKGTPSPYEMTAGAMAGLGVINNTGGFTLQGAFAKKIVNQGFVPDINNQIFIETELGPFFSGGSTAFMFSVHLRWDFNYTPDWTFYGLGGVGGNITGASLGDQFQLLPRFAGGLFYHFSAFNPPMSLRFELSHEMIVTGVSFQL